ncbi:DNA-nicking Smr family endonuclease [Shimia isoporae]|uniref:DNA-nicking Smr family endonuclease n=1 Tax=Shimia isoporae TaxID=647720 RepID=A0A4R1N9L1_9RHOB|nr:Smr/MutS family protein [Shimia isoporae]TCK99804.1 DNA-nicking Smr family endonuclease [Shimia isoporae]
MKRRRLSDDDLELWRKVARTAERLAPEARIVDAPAKTKPKPNAKKPAARPIATFEVGSKASTGRSGHDLLPGISERMAKQPVQMDKKAFGKLKRGKLKPEARIDLHGMTAQQAHGALNRFIMGAHSGGKRLVLVITGKGKDKFDDGPIPIRRGVLKHQVPQWLALPPLSGCVMQVAEAHISHGGSGAYYVYLRRR